MIVHSDVVESMSKICEFIGRFITALVIGIPIYILFLSILPRYLGYMEPKSIEEAVLGVISATLFFAIIATFVPPEQLGQVVVDKLSRFAKNIAKYLRRIMIAIRR